MYSFKRTEGWYEGRPVAAGSTPSKPSSATFSASTKASITRTGLLSSTQSSRLSGNSVDCARSAPATKRFINFPPRIIRRILAAPAFSHTQGHVQTNVGILINLVSWSLVASRGDVDSRSSLNSIFVGRLRCIRAIDAQPHLHGAHHGGQELELFFVVAVSRIATGRIPVPHTGE